VTAGLAAVSVVSGAETTTFVTRTRLDFSTGVANTADISAFVDLRDAAGSAKAAAAPETTVFGARVFFAGTGSAGVLVAGVIACDVVAVGAGTAPK
jgi:hypothetical protein